MFTIQCPICNKNMKKTEKQYICPKNHSFDIGTPGYVNLLLSGKKHTAIPGDNKEMVDARTDFLSAGYYEVLKNGLMQTISKLSQNLSSPVLIDAGCGEGYYTSGMAESLGENGQTIAFDISKFAVKSAAKRNKSILWAVASVFHMPVKERCADMITSIFAPIAPEEYHRVLKKGGYLIIVSPNENHLFSLKEYLYDNPYKNDTTLEAPKGFILVDQIEVGEEITVNGTTHIQSLFAMTPYYWKSPKESIEKLNQIDTLTTQADFIIRVFQKI